MNTTLLEKIKEQSDIIDRVHDRRLTWIDQLGSRHIFVLNTRRSRVKILMWVAQHTSGPFYLGGSTIGFMDDHDALMFRLGYV